MKLKKVRGGSTSSEGRAVLHYAVAESFVCGQDIKCAKEGLCTMEDAQTDFGGQFVNVAFPGKIIANSDSQKLE